MTAALRAEWLKLRTTKMALGLAGAVVALVVLAVTLHALGLKDLTDKSRQLAVLNESGGTLGPIFAALFGAMSITAEIRHGTIRPTFLGIPQRGRVIAAKAATSTAVGIVFGLVSTAVAAAVGSAGMSARGVTLHLHAGDYARMIGGGAAAAALMAVVGLGVGAIVRNQVAAVAGIFLWLLFVENVLANSVSSVNRYMPGGLARAITAQGDGLVHSPALAVVLLAAYAAAGAAFGWRTTLQRDFA